MVSRCDTPCRRQAAHERKEHGDRQADRDDVPRQRPAVDAERLRDRKDRCCDCKAKQSGQQAKQHRLRQNQRRHHPVRVAHGLQNGEFRDAFAHGLTHRVAGQEQQRKQHRTDDCVHHRADIAELSELCLRVLRLVLSERLVRRVREERIDRRAYLRGPDRIVDAHDERIYPTLVELSRLVEVVVIDDDAVRLRGRAGHVIGTDDLEVPVGAAILLDERRTQRHSIADLPAVRFHQYLANQRSRACRRHGLKLVGRYLPVRIDVEQCARVGRKHEHVIAPALVVAGERTHMGCAANAGDPLYAPQVCDWQRLDLTDATHDDEPIGVRAGEQAAKPRVDALEQPEEQEGDCGREQREHRPRTVAPQARPDQVEELHAATRASESMSRPLSR